MNTGIKNRISFTKAIQVQLSIIIVNFNVKYFLEQCLCSVIVACKNIRAEILVIDNHSTDGSKEYLAGRFKEVKFTWCSENGGFSKANNIGLEKATGDHILFLNPDTILPEDCLEKCLQFLEERKDVGALGIRMIDGSGQYLKESKRAFPSPFISFSKLSGLTRLFPHSKLFAAYYLGHLDPSKNNEVDVLAGAFMMVQKKVLDSIGGFDERFFMYGEDIDLSYRIQQSGFKNICFAGTTIIHFKGESTQKASLHYTRLFYGAMQLFVEKHYGRSRAGFYAFFIKAAIGLKAFTAVFGKLGPNNKTKTAPGRLVVVAGEGGFEQIKTVCQPHPGEDRIAGWYNPDTSAPVDNAALQQAIASIITSSQVTGIAFCNDALTSKEMIGLMEHLPGGMHYFFHFLGSGCIVGSSSKDSTGEAIVLNRK